MAKQTLMLADKSGLRRKVKGSHMSKKTNGRKENTEEEKEAIKKSFFATMAKIKNDTSETDEQKVERIRNNFNNNGNGSGQ